VAAGAVFTAVLFLGGRLLLHYLLLKSDITTLYGASASIVLLLLFVFYSALILYYGASFTVVWARRFQHTVKSLPHAQFYTIEEKTDDRVV
jgi:membrane protein